eukprot:scaffold48948_cov50-Phaeocystis_antarctica.AAC.3
MVARRAIPASSLASCTAPPTYRRPPTLPSPRALAFIAERLPVNQTIRGLKGDNKSLSEIRSSADVLVARVAFSSRAYPPPQFARRLCNEHLSQNNSGSNKKLARRGAKGVKQLPNRLKACSYFT